MIRTRFARTLPLLSVLSALAVLPWCSTAIAETCTREAARRIVDETGARLRVLTSETQPQVQSRLRRLKQQRGWADDTGDSQAAALLSDNRTAELDTKSARLLARIDELAEDGQSETIDCGRLGELDAVSLELQATVKAKSRYLLDRLDREIAGGTQPAPSLRAGGETVPSGSTPAQPGRAATPAQPTALQSVPAAKAPAPAPRPPGAASPSASTSPPASAAAPSPRSAPVPGRQAAASHGVPPPSPRPAPPVTGAWSTQTVERTLPPPAPLPPAMPPLPPPGSEGGGGNGFTQDEIANASRGFFGTISSSLANVIEHAFSTLGRPSAYVLGNEGGGAFIAGVRYGKGQLFMRDTSAREVYWHGPSIGYDVGASGSKTMFLVYNLKRDIDIFTGYSGVDGSAYLVGGVGMTLLTDGKVVMAPIRSGLGLRLGASIGYIRFTARPTWNPF